MKTAIYYLAIGMLVVFVGVIVFKLIFGTPCTVIGNYCVGDGWTIAGLAGTILAVAATLLGILGAFAVEAWWTGLDERVSKQIDASLKQQEEKINNQIDVMLARVDKVSKTVQEDLDRLSEKIVHDFTEVDQQVKSLHVKIQILDNQYDNVKKIAIDAALFGRPWNIEPLAKSLIDDFHMVEVAERMVDKYLGYIDGFLSQDEPEVASYSQSLIQQKAPSTDPLYCLEAALHWQKEVDNFNIKYPEIVQQVHVQIESYKKKINSSKPRTEQ